MTPESPSGKKLFLLDAYALIYRAYFAFIRAPRVNSKGLNTSAIFGFTNTLEQLLSAELPTHIAVCFDLHGDTFRHKMYKEYKANREQMPEDIRLSIPYIRDIIKAYNIPIYEAPGFEADDVICTIAQKAASDNFVSYMVTPDKDYAQVVGDNVYMFKPARSGKEPEIWGLPEVQENFQIVRADQVIDVLGLMGDSADNVPGCPGIGPKTAMKMISTYGSIDAVYENIDQFKGKQKEKLIENKEQVYLSRELVTINQNVAIDYRFDDMVLNEPNKEKLLALFNELEFRTFASKLGGGTKPPKKAPQQTSLFDTAEEELVVDKSKIDDILSVNHQYIKVENEMQRASLRAELSVAKEFCFDTETTGLNHHTSEVVCISFAIQPHQAYCVMLPSDKKQTQLIINEFKHVFEDEKVVKIGQNIKFDMLMLANYNIEVKGPLFDTMIGHYLVQPDQKHNLDFLCETYLNYKKVPTEDLIGKKGKSQGNMRSVEDDKIVEYACEDADLTLQLKPIIEAELQKQELTNLFESIEMPLIPVLADMERTGARVDKSALDEYAKDLRIQIIELEKEIHDLAGRDFNIGSPKQLGVILFEVLEIDSNAKKTKTKQYSTSEDVLQRLSGKHPIIDKVLNYRGLRKLLNTYVEALPKLINSKTGRIHTSYNQAVASTGRLSSVNPNLQNIPIRDANGRQIRKAFTPSHESRLFLSADYSQIELRIMAALSKDENMAEAFRNNADIHSITAARIFGISQDDVTTDMRRKAKTANFGIIYGISAFGLSQRLNISRTEAKAIIDGYFEAFPSVKAYMDKSIEVARNDGYVSTLFGRRRYLRDINSANSVVRGVAERNAINSPIQGTAADIIKIAMINIFNRFNENNIKSKMILQVHDELNFDVIEDEIDKVKEIVKKEMENALNLDIPLIVEMDSGANWLEAH